MYTCVLIPLPSLWSDAMQIDQTPTGERTDHHRHKAETIPLSPFPVLAPAGVLLGRRLKYSSGVIPVSKL